VAVNGGGGGVDENYVVTLGSSCQRSSRAAHVYPRAHTRARARDALSAYAARIRVYLTKMGKEGEQRAQRADTRGSGPATRAGKCPNCVYARSIHAGVSGALSFALASTDSRLRIKKTRERVSVSNVITETSEELGSARENLSTIPRARALASEETRRYLSCTFRRGGNIFFPPEKGRFTPRCVSRCERTCAKDRDIVYTSEKGLHCVVAGRSSICSIC